MKFGVCEGNISVTTIECRQEFLAWLGFAYKNTILKVLNKNCFYIASNLLKNSVSVPFFRAYIFVLSLRITEKLDLNLFTQCFYWIFFGKNG